MDDQLKRINELDNLVKAITLQEYINSKTPAYNRANYHELKRRVKFINEYLITEQEWNPFKKSFWTQDNWSDMGNTVADGFHTAMTWTQVGLASVSIGGWATGIGAPVAYAAGVVDSFIDLGYAIGNAIEGDWTEAGKRLTYAGLGLLPCAGDMITAGLKSTDVIVTSLKNTDEVVDVISTVEKNAIKNSDEILKNAKNWNQNSIFTNFKTWNNSKLIQDGTNINVINRLDNAKRIQDALANAEKLRQTKELNKVVGGATNLNDLVKAIDGGKDLYKSGDFYNNITKNFKNFKGIDFRSIIKNSPKNTFNFTTGTFRKFHDFLGHTAVKPGKMKYLWQTLGIGAQAGHLPTFNQIGHYEDVYDDDGNVIDRKFKFSTPSTIMSGYEIEYIEPVTGEKTKGNVPPWTFNPFREPNKEWFTDGEIDFDKVPDDWKTKKDDGWELTPPLKTPTIPVLQDINPNFVPGTGGDSDTEIDTTDIDTDQFGGIDLNKLNNDYFEKIDYQKQNFNPRDDIFNQPDNLSIPSDSTNRGNLNIPDLNKKIDFKKFNFGGKT